MLYQFNDHRNSAKPLLASSQENMHIRNKNRSVEFVCLLVVNAIWNDEIKLDAHISVLFPEAPYLIQQHHSNHHLCCIDVFFIYFLS